MGIDTRQSLDGLPFCARSVVRVGNVITVIFSSLWPSYVLPFTHSLLRPHTDSNNAELPTDCAVCGLKLVLSPHLARSFHHLFPVQPFAEVAVVKQATPKEIKSLTSSSSALPTAPESINSDLLVNSESDDSCCVACLRPFAVTLETTATSSNAVVLRFACPDCHSLFCVDCDVFLHESLHNCPGCLAR